MPKRWGHIVIKHQTIDKFIKFVKRKIMNTIELRKNFHNLIDSIDNENLLMNFYDIIKSRTRIQDGELWSRLNEKEQEELLNAFEESENPDNLIDNEKMKLKHRKWL